MIGSSNALATKFDVLGERTDNPSGTVVWSGITTEIISKYQYIGVEHQYYNWSTSTGEAFWDYVPVYALLNWTGNHYKCTGHASNEWVSIWIANGVLNSTGSYEKIKRIIGIVGGGGITGTTSYGPISTWTQLWTGSVSASRGNSASGTATLSQTYKNFPFIYFVCCAGTTSDHKFVQRINTAWFQDRTNTSGNQYIFRQSEADMSHNVQTNPSNDTKIYIWVYSASVIGIYGAYI